MEQKRSLAMPGWQGTAGARNPQAKLTDDQVRAIRAAPCSVRVEVLAVEFGVCSETIRKIRRRERYRSVV